LELQNIPRLYSTDPEFDHRVELRKLKKELLAKYLELLGNVHDKAKEEVVI
jgi:hypothetical protein